MFRCLESWLNTPFKVLRNAGYTISCDKKPSIEIDLKGYVSEEITPITDKTGKEYISRTQIYTANENNLSADDQIEYNGKAYEIRKLSMYREGKTGDSSIQVAYL